MKNEMSYSYHGTGVFKVWCIMVLLLATNLTFMTIIEIALYWQQCEI